MGSMETPPLVDEWPDFWRKRWLVGGDWNMNGWWFSLIFHILGIPPSSYLLKPDHDFFFRSWRELSKLATFWTWFQTWINHRNVSRFFITVSKRLTTPVTSHQVSVHWGSPIYFSRLWCPWHHASKVPVSLERTSRKIPWDSDPKKKNDRRRLMKVGSYHYIYGYGSIPIDTITIVGWTSIYQLFWGSLGT